MTHWTRRAAAALLLGASASACTLAEVSEPISENVVVVEGVLRTDVGIQRVLLHRSLNGRIVEGVPGAVVTVTGEDGAEHLFLETGNSCYRYSPRYFEVRPGDVRATCYESAPGQPPFVFPGAVYELRVDLPDGGVIRGRTTVPGSFGLRGVPYSAFEDHGAACWIPGDVVLPLSWTRSAGAWSYLAPIRVHGIRKALQQRGIDADIPDPLELQGLAVSEADTTIAFPTEFGVFERFEIDSEVLAALQGGLPPNTDADLVVAAADRNYVNGVRGGRFNPSGPVRVSSVVGDGVGVFGSLVPLALRIDVGGPRTANEPPCAGAPKPSGSRAVPGF